MQSTHTGSAGSRAAPGAASSKKAFNHTSSSNVPCWTSASQDGSKDWTSLGEVNLQCREGRDFTRNARRPEGRCGRGPKPALTVPRGGFGHLMETQRQRIFLHQEVLFPRRQGVPVQVLGDPRPLHAVASLRRCREHLRPSFVQAQPHAARQPHGFRCMRVRCRIHVMSFLLKACRVERPETGARGLGPFLGVGHVGGHSTRWFAREEQRPHEQEPTQASVLGPEVNLHLGVARRTKGANRSTEPRRCRATPQGKPLLQRCDVRRR